MPARPLRLASRLLVPLALAAAAVASPTRAGPPKGPQPGQAGKDVLWIPSPEPLVVRMLTMAQVTASDLVVDLGAGDGRTVILAARQFGARALGIEFDAGLVKLARRAAKDAGLPAGRARFVQGDIFAVDFSEATVVALYLLPALNKRLRPTLLRMRPGTRVVSHQFDMDDWTPDETSYVDARAAYLWIVPAQVAGGWRIELSDGTGVDLDFEQNFQKLRGRVDLGAVRGGLRDTSLRGEELRFSYVDAAGVRLDFTGRVRGDRIEGTVDRGGKPGAFTATRRPPP